MFGASAESIPDRLLEGDIRRLSASSLKRKLDLRKGQVDLIAGCPPCQAFSAMRTLNGSRVVRGGGKNLVFEFVRFVRALLPRAIMMENVPGLSRDRRMPSVLRQLSKLGYACEFRVLDVADYGVPQRRRRLILLGSRSGRVQFASPSKRRKTVRDAIGMLPKPGHSGDPIHDLVGKHGPKVSALIKRIRRNGGSRTELPRHSQLECHKSTTGFKDVYGRMAWDKVAPTITTGCVNPSKGRFLHPVQNRAVTLREAALLQSFPPCYYFSLESGKFPAASLIGNALPPEFVRRHARKIAAHLRQNTGIRRKHGR
jgi:DNA (cytosine-5)-methyltransferase 1